MICSHRNVKFIKSEFNSFQILFILHSIYEITTNDIGLIGKRIIRTEYRAFAFFSAKNFLITLSSTDVFCIWLNKICKKKFKWNLNCDCVICIYAYVIFWNLQIRICSQNFIFIIKNGYMNFLHLYEYI